MSDTSKVREFIAQLLRNPVESFKTGVPPQDEQQALTQKPEPQSTDRDDVMRRKQKSINDTYNGPGIRS